MPAARQISYDYDYDARRRLTTYGDGSPGIERSYTADDLPSQVWCAGSVWIDAARPLDF